MSDLAILIIGTVVLGIVLTSTLMGFLGAAGGKEVLSATRAKESSMPIGIEPVAPQQTTFASDVSGSHFKLRAQA